MVIIEKGGKFDNQTYDMEEKGRKTRENIDYGVFALFPVFVFIGLYIGCGCVFTLLKAEEPFGMMPRYTAIVAAIIVALVCFDPGADMAEKVEAYCTKAGKKGVMLLGLIVLMAGGFAGATEVIGGKESIINLGVTFIPSHFLVPGIFVICAVISTCIGTSMGALVTMVPIACSLAAGAGLDMGMTGAAAITGSFFGDNLSMISDTTICATKGVGAEMDDKFRVNFLLAIPAAVITVVIYMILSSGSAADAVSAGNYHLATILPYLLVLILAVVGVNVVMALAAGIFSCGIIGVFVGTASIFDWAKAVSTGMEGMFWPAVFTTLVSGLIGLVEIHGGIEWLVRTISAKIKNRKGCEAMIGLLALVVSGVIVNNTMAIIITAPVAKELGGKYRVEPKRMASLLDIGACVAVMIAPHGSGIMMLEKITGCSYIDILKYQFYPLLLIGCTAGMIWIKKK